MGCRLLLVSGVLGLGVNMGFGFVVPWMFGFKGSFGV